MSDKPINILLIEDNPDDAELLGEFLNREVIRFDLVHAMRLREGISHLTKREFDIILLDLSLPDGEGMPVVDQIRNQKDPPPIVILTGREDEDLALQTLQKGIQDYLPKSRLSGEMLVRSIRYAIERRQSEVKIRQAQRMEAIGQLAGGVAHDFNNLLTIIQGYSDLAQSQLDSREIIQSALEEISQASQRAAALTQQLLSFSRPQALTPQALDVNQVLEDMQKMLERLISEDIEVRFELEPDLDDIKADQGQLEQVILNLAINGRDSMPQGGRLTLSTQQIEAEDIPGSHASGAYIRLSVRDTGTGIDPQLLPHIFEPFVTNKEIGQGTGLGLSNVQGILEEMDGWIDLDSKLGQGTVFYVYLPICRQGQATGVAAPVEKEKTVDAGVCRTIMLVDDESNIRKMLSIVLEAENFKTITVANAREAIDTFKKMGAEIDLVLTDIVMPGMNGVELAGRLVEMRPDLKVLFMSGYPMDSLSRQQIDVSDLELLHKPFTPDRLVARLNEMF